MWKLDADAPLPLWRPDETETPFALAFTTRRGGVSAPPFDSLNLGRSTADRAEAVLENRRRGRDAVRGSIPDRPAHGGGESTARGRSDEDLRHRRVHRVRAALVFLPPPRSRRDRSPLGDRRAPRRADGHASITGRSRTGTRERLPLRAPLIRLRGDSCPARRGREKGGKH